MTAGQISPPVDGTDDSIFYASPFLQGVIPPITEYEWLEAWSAIVEFSILFRGPFLSSPTTVSPWGWVIPPDFASQSTEHMARLWVPSIRQISQFLLRGAPFSPKTPGMWARLMETTLVGMIKADAFVPFTMSLISKYKVPYAGTTIESPWLIDQLFEAGPGGFLGSFVVPGSSFAPHNVVLLVDRSNHAITGLAATPARCPFIPSFSCKGMKDLLGLGLTSQLEGLLDAAWTPVAEAPTLFTPGPLAELDFSATEDSILRMAFGGTPPSDAVFTGILRGTVEIDSSALKAPFMSSPLSLLFFEKAIIQHIASIRDYADDEYPSHSYGKAQLATDIPADPAIPESKPSVLYTPATVRIPAQAKVYDEEFTKYKRTGFDRGYWTRTGCPEDGVTPPTDSGSWDDDLTDPENDETGNPDAPYEGGLSAIYAEAMETGAPEAVAYEQEFGVSLRAEVGTYVGTSSTSGDDDHGGACTPSGSFTNKGGSSHLEAYDNAHKLCQAYVKVPLEAFPASKDPWTSSVFDLIKGAIGEPELKFLVANDLIGTVRLYISVWIPGMSTPSGAQNREHKYTLEYTQNNGQPPAPDPVETLEIDPGYPKTPVTVAQTLLDPVIAALNISPSGVLPSGLVGQCQNGGGVFVDSDSPPIDNSLSVEGMGTFIHKSVLLWEGEGAFLQTKVTEASLWSQILKETSLMAAIDALVELPPSISHSLITINIDSSGSNATSSYSGGQVVKSEGTYTHGGARFRFAMGDIYFKAEYKFSHYRAPKQA